MNRSRTVLPSVFRKMRAKYTRCHSLMFMQEIGMKYVEISCISNYNLVGQTGAALLVSAVQFEPVGTSSHGMPTLSFLECCAGQLAATCDDALRVVIQPS